MTRYLLFFLLACGMGWGQETGVKFRDHEESAIPPCSDAHDKNAFCLMGPPKLSYEPGLYWCDKQGMCTLLHAGGNPPTEFRADESQTAEKNLTFNDAAEVAPITVYGPDTFIKDAPKPERRFVPAIRTEHHEKQCIATYPEGGCADWLQGDKLVTYITYECSDPDRVLLPPTKSGKHWCMRIDD